MNSYRALIERARSELHAAQRILIVSHIRPDGDAIGSLLGLGLALQGAGKRVQMVLSDGVPTTFRNLSGAELICKRAEGDFDCLVTVDCSELPRVGEALGAYLGGGRIPDLNIDHHITNTGFARLNIVQPDAVATSEMLAKLLPKLNLCITAAIASALLSGILTDTLGFRTANMTSQVLRTAANLVDAGANIPDLYYRALIQRSFQAGRYWGAGLSKLQREDGVVWTSLTLDDRRLADYPGRDDADLINIVSAINGAQVALIFIEQTGGKVKVSWRSQPGVDVSGVAMSFGGGGHMAAAGAEIEGKLEEVQRSVLHATRTLLEHNQQAG